MKTYTISWNGHSLHLGERTTIMGVLNVTPDSFSDGGRFLDFDAAVAHAREMVNAGADIIDIGGESTRPFSEPVSPEMEIHRVIPVIERLSEIVRAPISIDTTKAEVARRAIHAGASIINDISALRVDPEMAKVVAEAGVPIVLMHMKGTPKSMQKSPVYEDLIREIKDFLKDAIFRAVQNKIETSKIIVDPGIGFGKTFDHNLSLLKHLKEFESLDAPILVGASRKAFIRNILTQGTGKEVSPDQPEVETGSLAAVAAAVLNGAHIVRVHDVASTRVALKVIDAIRAST